MSWLVFSLLADGTNGSNDASGDDGPTAGASGFSDVDALFFLLFFSLCFSFFRLDFFFSFLSFFIFFLCLAGEGAGLASLEAGVSHAELPLL